MTTPGVAIVGMACLFPGAGDVDAYWRNICAKVDATSDPPPEAWDPDVYWDPEFADEDRTYCKRGGYLGAMAKFAPLEHGVPPVAVGGEPDQWLALQVARDALLDAGAGELPEEVRARTAVILGKGTYLNGGNAIAVQRMLVVGQTIDLLRQLEPQRSEESLARLRAELEAVLPPLGPETVPGLIPNIIVGRIANRLDLMGPAYTVDAACASSLVAVQHAVRDLLSGDADLAVAGGSQVWMPVATLNVFCRLGALSRRGQLRAFDALADGTLLSEGIGAVVLKRVPDAVADGDRIYAVIRGVGVASDGRGLSVMAPRAEGEETALRRAYEAAGVSPSTVGLIEAHGTGTPVGDATEVHALTQVFGERHGGLPRTALGTVKSMIGHTIPAAGVAGLIKTALALHHRVLPPTLNCEQPNPELGLERSPFYVNTETRPWIHGAATPRRAGINAFGFGGINAHAVLEEWQGDPQTPHADHRPPWDSELCLLQADSPAALADAAAELHDALSAQHELPLADLAFTLQQSLGASAQPRRLAIVASSIEDLQKKLAVASEKLRKDPDKRIKTTSGIYCEPQPLGPDAKVVFVFPGEGAQYPNMLADLCLHFEEARAVFDRIDRLYADHPRGELLSDWVFPRPAFSEEERARAEARLMELDIAVEAVLTANAAAYAVLSRLIGRCDALLGHSSGEHSAAMAAGALDLDTDERLAAFCHGLYASYADAAERHEVPAAVLLAIGSDAETARRIAAQAGGELYLAMDNCPHQVVLVGEAQASARARQIATDEGLMCELLPYDRAVHTPMFAPFAEDLRAIFAGMPVRSADRPLWSCTTASPYPEDPAAIRELLVEHWTAPVRFRETIEALHDDGARVFVEAGPRGNMTSFVEDILRGRDAVAVAADVRRRSGTAQLCHLAGMLAAHHVELNLGYLFEQRRARLVDWRSPAPSEHAGRTLEIPLSTAWPMLRLGEDALERLRHGDAHEPAHNGAAPEPNGLLQAHGHTEAAVDEPDPPPARAYENANGHAAPAVPALAMPAPAVAPDPLLPTAQALLDEGSAAALEGYLATMQQFLHANEEVMHAYLQGAAAELVPAPAPATAPTSAPEAGGQPAAHPLLGTIVSCEPERELVARRVFDPRQDRYLLDHTLGRQVSRSDPELHALALMPFAMSIEILAEAAARLLPGLLVTGLRDVRAHRWLAFAEAPQTLELSASRLDGAAPAEGDGPGQGGCERVRVQLRNLDEGALGGQPVVEGTVLLAGAYAQAPAPLQVALDGGRPSRWPPEQLYSEAMFHQPLWQGVREVELVAAGAARARLQVLPREGMLAGAARPEFALDPVALDAAGQLVGFWTAEMLESARVVFPFRLAALDLYGPPLPAGEQLSCSAAIELEGELLVRADIDVLEAGGRPWMRLSGWEDKRFPVPERFAALAHPSRLEPLSQPWREPLAAFPADAPLRCRQLDARLPGDRGLWMPVWAGRVLGRRERELFASLTLPEARKLEWLAARTAAKEGVAELLAAFYGIALQPAEIEILPDGRGAPVVAIAGLDAGVQLPAVSLTHTHGRAAALVALLGPGASVGIDVERLTPRPPGFAQAAFSDGELALLPELGERSGAPSPQAEEWQLRLWCAREAAGKALGLGLGDGGDAPRVSALQRERELASVDVNSHHLLVWTRRVDDLIVASTVHTDTPLDEEPWEARR
ncbi:MAG TPA: beta-ketoacyl synthase N-terminal-like domain-containing protein [Solirubrobacteraceae bacterium]|nr:beta-ketoacyl synthase N-terminal-like domain-containing protein [Solirubrobacteraceae bacterium]